MSESPLQYLPHRPPMVFIDEIEWVDENSKTCKCNFKVKEDFFLHHENSIPGVVLIEIMAQASACLKGWIDVHRGLPVRLGYLVGIEEITFYDVLRPGDQLDIDTRMAEEISDYFRFNCSVKRDGSIVAEGLLSFMVP